MTSHEFTKVALKQMEGLLEGALMNGRSEGLGYAAGLLRTVAAGGAEVALDGFDVAQAQQVLAAYRAAAEAFNARVLAGAKAERIKLGVLWMAAGDVVERCQIPKGTAGSREWERLRGALADLDKDHGDGEAADRAAAEVFHARESKNWKPVVLAAGVLLAKINREQEKDGWAAARATEEYMGLEKALVEMNKNPGEGEAG